LCIGKLSEAERRRMLADFDRLVPMIPGRPAAEVDGELNEIRKARRRGGRKGARRNPRDFADIPKLSLYSA
jgi:hypothetical protein